MGITKHGMSRRGQKAREYTIWLGMRDRCHRKKNKAYPSYGEAGVKVSPGWDNLETGFENFINDMGPCPSPGHSLDRYPNKNGNYEPGNCRWATRTEQNRNRKNVKWLTIDGIKRSIPELALMFGISRKLIYDRLRRGYSPKQAIVATVDPLNGRAHMAGKKKIGPSKENPQNHYQRKKAIPGVEFHTGDRVPDSYLILKEYLGTKSKSPNNPAKVSWWLTICVYRGCGVEKPYQEYVLKDGGAISCGCFKKQQLGEATTTHGDCKNFRSTPERKAWSGMKQRCNNPKDKRFKDYGGRGIRVCEQWLHSYETFLKDVGRKPEGKYSLERKDVDGNYEPGNVYWADASTQAMNKRNTLRISIGGNNLTLMECQEKFGVPYHRIWHRINVSKWSPEKAVGLVT